MRAIADQSRTIRLPVHVHDLLNSIKKITREMHVELGRVPTEAEVAERMDIALCRARVWISRYSVGCSPVWNLIISCVSGLSRPEKAPLPPRLLEASGLDGNHPEVRQEGQLWIHVGGYH